MCAHAIWTTVSWSVVTITELFWIDFIVLWCERCGRREIWNLIDQGYHMVSRWSNWKEGVFSFCFFFMNCVGCCCFLLSYIPRNQIHVKFTSTDEVVACRILFCRKIDLWCWLVIITINIKPISKLSYSQREKEAKAHKEKTSAWCPLPKLAVNTEKCCSASTISHHIYLYFCCGKTAPEHRF